MNQKMRKNLIILTTCWAVFTAGLLLGAKKTEAAAKPDLTIVTIKTVSPSISYYKICALVKNIGDVNIGGPSPDWAIKISWTFDNLPADEVYIMENNLNAGGQAYYCTAANIAGGYDTHLTKVTVDSTNIVDESNENNNIYVLNKGGLLNIIDLQLSPESPKVGQNLKVTFKGLEGDGSTATLEEYFNVQYYIYKNNSYITAGNADHIGDGSWQFTSVPLGEIGDYRVDISLYCATNGQICAGKYYTNNETAKKSVNFTVKALPDLIITDVQWSPQQPKTKEDITFSVTIKNQGNADVVGPFDVYVIRGGEVLSGVNAGSLIKGQSKIVEIKYVSQLNIGLDKVVVEVDPTLSLYHIEESNEDNNKIQREIKVLPNYPAAASGTYTLKYKQTVELGNNLILRATGNYPYEIPFKTAFEVLEPDGGTYKKIYTISDLKIGDIWSSGSKIPDTSAIKMGGYYYKFEIKVEDITIENPSYFTTITKVNIISKIPTYGGDDTYNLYYQESAQLNNKAIILLDSIKNITTADDPTLGPNQSPAIGNRFKIYDTNFNLLYTTEYILDEMARLPNDNTWYFPDKTSPYNLSIKPIGGAVWYGGNNQDSYVKAIVKGLAPESQKKPDLTITDITFEPANPKPGELFKTFATIKNIGERDILSPGCIYINYNWSEKTNTENRCVSPLPVGMTFISQYNTFLNTPGEHLLKVTIDSTNIVNESNETNNTLEKTITIKENKIDLSVSDITIKPESPKIGENIEITATIKNIGLINTPPEISFISWKWSCGRGVSESATVGDSSNFLPSLKAGESIKRTILCKYSTEGQSIIKFTIDDNNQITESNENNNSLDKNITVGEFKPDLTVISPNGGDIWVRGQTYPIKWVSSGGLASKINISLYTGQTTYDIATNVYNSGRYDWLIPSSLAENSKYRIIITNIDNGDFDQSDRTFTLTNTFKPEKNYSISSSPVSVLADGEAISNVVVLAKDDQGSPVSGKQASISSSRSSLDTIKTIVGVTSSEGKAVFTVSSKTEGVSTYTATVDGSVINQTTQVTFRKPEAIYPEGTLIQVKGDATIYVIKEGEKKPIPSPSVLRDNGYSFDKVIKVEETISNQYPTGDTDFYRDGKVLKYGNDIYVISQQEKRRVTSLDALKRFGYGRIITVAKTIIDSYPEGDPLTSNDLYPDGTLLKASNSLAVYYLWGNKLNAIYSADVFNAYHNQWQDVVTVSPQEIKKYSKGGVFYFPKGALIKQAGKPDVYLIDDNDKKRPIVSGDVFEKLGFEWKNINETEAAVINRYPAGEVIKE